MNIETLVSVKDAARSLGVSVTAVHRLCGRGTLASVWIGSQRFIRREVLEQLKSNMEYRRRSRARSVRGKSLDQLVDEGQLTLGGIGEEENGKSNA